MRLAFQVVLCFMVVAWAPAAAVAQRSSDKAPSWYTGEIPWSALNDSTKQRILNLHAGFEAAKAHANQPGSESPSAERAKGEALVAKIVRDYNLDRFYRTPSLFGDRMVLWLPSAAWASLTPSQKHSIVAFVRSSYANWGIGVGRVRGQDVLSDRLVLTP